jgi:hypothetical protein
MAGVNLIHHIQDGTKVAGCYKHGDEPSGSIDYGEIIDRQVVSGVSRTPPDSVSY